jgi:iron complex transport system ATP-binding protein
MPGTCARSRWGRCEQRRVLVGRALVQSADMLLLDEPSNTLDLSAQRELRELLRKLAQGGTGILMITHHIADIIPEIDRVLMMKDGRIVADGRKKELLTERRLGDLFSTEVRLAQREGFYHAW